jgi:hypothetical protein
MRPVATRLEPAVLEALDAAAVELSRTTLGAMRPVSRSDAARILLNLAIERIEGEGIEWVVGAFTLGAGRQVSTETATPPPPIWASWEPPRSTPGTTPSLPPPPERRAEGRPQEGAWARTGDNNRSPAHLVERETAGGMLRFKCGRTDDPRSWKSAPKGARRCRKCEA